MAGFNDYLDFGKLTESFMVDYSRLCEKIYKQWHLQAPLEEFEGYCVEKLVVRIPMFDSTRSNIGNYVYNLILNEARRVHSRELSDNPVDLEEVSPYLEDTSDYGSLVDDVYDFACLAYKRGLYIDQTSLIARYQTCQMTPLVKVFTWFRRRASELH